MTVIRTVVNLIFLAAILSFCFATVTDVSATRDKVGAIAQVEQTDAAYLILREVHDLQGRVRNNCVVFLFLIAVLYTGMLFIPKGVRRG